jgi:hypothetical protein
VAITFNQEKDGPGGVTGDAVTLNASTPANALLVALVFWDNNVPFGSLVDDIGNTYLQVNNEIDANFTKSRVYKATNATAGTRTVTLTAGSSFSQILVAEYVGHDLVAGNDCLAQGSGANETDPTLNITTIADPVLVIAFGVSNHPTVSVSTAGFTNRSPGSAGVLADKLITPAGLQTVTFHNTTQPANWHRHLAGWLPLSTPINPYNWPSLGNPILAQ